MYKIIKYFSFIVYPLAMSLILLGIPIEPLSAEEISITTYYPAPNGYYDRLAANKLIVDVAQAQAEYSLGPVNMQNGDVHIGRSLIIGNRGDLFSYSNLAPARGEVFAQEAVRIGTLAPNADTLLQVEETDNTKHLKVSMRHTGSSTSRIAELELGVNVGGGPLTTVLRAESSGTTGVVGTSTNHNLSIRTNNTNRVYIQQNGKITVLNADSIAEPILNVNGITAVSQSVTVGQDLNVTGPIRGGNDLYITGGAHINAGIQNDATDWVDVFDSEHVFGGLTVDLNIWAGMIDAITFGPILWLELNAWFMTSLITALASVAIIGLIAFGLFGSSIRFKENVETIDNALEKVMKLRGVEFNWKRDGKRDMGLIAEEVVEVVPEVIIWEKDGKQVHGVNSPNLVGLLVEAIKEQQQQIEALKEKVNSLLEQSQVQLQPATP